MADLLIEVRCEELPVSMIEPALIALEAGLLGLLSGVSHAGVRRFSTPRRLAVVVEDLAEGRAAEEQLVSGPALAVAQRDGQWTPAAQGFARGRGASVDDLQVIDGPKGKVIALRVKTGGERTETLIADGLEKLILGLPFKKSMRWGSGPARWGRPLHQVVAVFGGRRIDATVAGITTTDAVIGHRRSPLPPGPVTDAASYVVALEARWVLVDRDKRRERIREGLLALAAREGVQAHIDAALLEEVTDLVEWPMPLVGRFDADLLELPNRLLEESMRVHQRYFPSRKDGKMHNLFFVVSNNPEGDAALIAAGNARVLAARFHDAKFFYAEDRKLSLAQHGAELRSMQWVRGLGTMAEKQERVAALGSQLVEVVGGELTVAFEAGSVCKSDLLSQMVREFPELQGHMGRLYAEHGGASGDVALAIEEHYLPRFAGDALPSTAAGSALALADRLDTLAGCFGIGLVPKGSADPQGLRRAANGVLAIILGGGLRLRLGTLIALALDGYERREGSSVQIRRPRAEVADLLESFILERLRAQLQAEGHATDVVEAVLSAGGDEPVQVRARVEALTALSRQGAFGPLMVAFKRVLNISKDHRSKSFDPALFAHASEQALADGFASARAVVDEAVEGLRIGDALASMVALKPAIDQFFNDVLVMAEDPAVRDNRLGLLCSISALFRAVADFRTISTE